MLIDQSGSMGGPPFGGDQMYSPAGNDPIGLRFEVQQYIFQYLSYLVDASPTVARPEVNVATVSFGTFPRDILNWINIAPGTPNWEDALQDLLNGASVSRWQNRNLGETNFEDAYARVVELFKTGLNKPGVTYRNVVLLLTDGAPCSSADPLFHEQESGTGRIVYNCRIPDKLTAMNQHLARLKTLVANALPSSDFNLYIIALDVGVPQPYWPEFSDDWAEIVCSGVTLCDPSIKYAKVDTASRIGNQVNRILEDAAADIFPAFTSADVPIPQGTFTVLPYQQLLRVDFFKKENVSLAASFSANGSPQTVHPASAAPAIIESYIFDLPQPGDWQISLADWQEIENIRFSTLPAIIVADPLDDGEIFSTYTLTARLSHSASNVPLATDTRTEAEYPLSLTAKIYDATLPDKDSRPLVQEIALSRTASANIYEYAETWTPVEAGNYEIRIDAVFSTPDGFDMSFITEQTVIDWIVIAGSNVDWKGVEPSSERIDRHFTVTAEAVNALTNTPLRNPGKIQVRATITHQDGTPYDIYVLDNRSTIDGEILANFVIRDPGIYTTQFEAIYDDGAASVPFVLTNRSHPQDITVRPLHPLSLRITRPSGGAQEMQHFTLSPFELNFNLSVDVQLEMYDGLSQQPVSLATAVNDPNARPRLVLNGTTDLTDRLKEIQPGIYTVQLTDLGLGDFTLQADANAYANGLTGDYVWSATTTRVEFSRTFSASLLTAILTLLAFIVLLLGTGYVLWRQSVYLAEYPLTGDVVFGVGEDDELVAEVASAYFKLGKRTMFRQTYKGALPAPFHSVKVTFTTRRNEINSKNGFVYIEDLFINREKVVFSRVIKPGDGWTMVKASTTGPLRLYAKKVTKGIFENLPQRP